MLLCCFYFVKRATYIVTSGTAHPWALLKKKQTCQKNWINTYHVRIHRPFQTHLPPPALSATTSYPTSLAALIAICTHIPCAAHAIFSSKASPIERRRPHPRERSRRQPPIWPAEYDVAACSSSTLRI